MAQCKDKLEEIKHFLALLRDTILIVNKEGLKI